MSRHLVLVVVTLAFVTSAGSQEKKPPEKKKAPPPKMLYCVPLVVKPGEKQKLVLRGKNLADVKEVKVNGAPDAKLKVLAAKAVAVPNNYPADRVGDSEVEIELELPKEVKPGEVTLTAIGPGGNSNAYAVLLRGAAPFVLEKEPNDGFDQSQIVKVPCAVEGTIKSERDVDVFKFEGKKGDKLRIEVLAARYGSPADAMLVLTDSSRAIIESADDSEGTTDPVIEITLPKDGPFFISVIEAHDLGGSNFGYQLVIVPRK